MNLSPAALSMLFGRYRKPISLNISYAQNRHGFCLETWHKVS